MKKLICAWLMLASGVFAAVPSEINYQGRLTDSSGNPVAGSVAMSVKLFDAAAAGNELYSEDIGTVNLSSNGIYSFQFGAGGLSVVNGSEVIATADGTSKIYSKALSGTPLAGTLTVTDGTYSWNIVDGNPYQQAAASAIISYGFVVAGTVVNGGSGYITAPAVTITGNGNGATATATLSGGVVTGISMISAGSGYTTATITIAPPPMPFLVDYSGGIVSVTYNSAPTAGTEIRANYKLNESALVGALTGAGSHWLELFVNGVAQSPREKILAVPYAVQAGYANEAGLASEAGGALRTELDALQTQVSSDTTPAGTVVMSATYPNPELEAQGYSVIEQIPGQNWVFTGTRPGSFYGEQSAVWAGKIWHAAVGAYGVMDVWFTEDGGSWTCATTDVGCGARDDFSLTAFDGKLWLMGGGAYNDVWCSADGTNWTQVTASAPWASRSGHAVAVFNNKLWLIGGGGYSDVWCSADGTNWTQVTASAPWSARYGHAVAVFNNKLWLMGGNNSERDVWLSADGIEWTCATEQHPFLPQDWSEGVSACEVAGRMYVKEKSSCIISATTNGTDWQIAGVYGLDAYATVFEYKNSLWALSGYSLIARSDSVKQDNGLYYYKKN